MQVHPTAEVSEHAVIGSGTKIWNYAQIRENAHVGTECVIGTGAYIDTGVRIGNRVKVQNYALIYCGTVIEDRVFIGPGACLANDRFPRSTAPEGNLKSASEWERGSILVREGAAIGAGAVLVPDVEIGAWSLVAAGAIVVSDVPQQALVAGNPARFVGHVCRCGHRLRETVDAWVCQRCGRAYKDLLSGGLDHKS